MCNQNRIAMNTSAKYFIVAIALLQFISFPGYSQEEKPDDLQRNQLIDAARDIMASAGTCALITIDQQGRPRVRAMDPFPPEEDFSVWFGTKLGTRKVEQIKNDPRVTLYYLADNQAGYVMIHGEAKLVYDQDEKDRRWKEEWEAFYKNKTEDYLLIRVIPEWMEVISYTHGIQGDPETWKPPMVLFGGDKEE
jgi:general stress protein 26